MVDHRDIERAAAGLYEYCNAHAEVLENLGVMDGLRDVIEDLGNEAMEVKREEQSA